MSARPYERKHDPQDLQRLEHATKLFLYHADQRMKAFQFFTVFVGLLSVGFATAMKQHLPGFAAAIGMLGFAASCGFIILDFRNVELMSAALDEVERYEYAIGMRISATGRKAKSPGSSSESRNSNSDSRTTGTAAASNGKLSFLVTHAFVFRAMEGIVGALSLAGAIWGFDGLDGPGWLVYVSLAVGLATAILLAGHSAHKEKLTDERFTNALHQFVF